MIHLSFSWLFAGIGAVCVNVLLASGQEFPVPRAEAEFRELLPFVQGWGAANRGDLELFRRWAMPFGPLDLEIREGTADEAEALRSFYLGVAGGVFGIDSAALAASFHCGNDCVKYRKGEVLRVLADLHGIVSEFRVCPGVRLIAQWGWLTEFRINDLYQIENQARLTKPSRTMGLVPSGNWMTVEDPEEFIRKLGADPARVRKIVSEMRAHSIAAIVREEAYIRVVQVGIGDNEAGVLFGGDAAPYKDGQKLRDGRRVIVIEPLKPGVYYYETT